FGDMFRILMILKRFLQLGIDFSQLYFNKTEFVLRVVYYGWHATGHPIVRFCVKTQRTGYPRILLKPLCDSRDASLKLCFEAAALGRFLSDGFISFVNLIFAPCQIRLEGSHQITAEINDAA